MAENQQADQTSSYDFSVKRDGLSDKQFRKLSMFIEEELGIRMPPAKKIMLESRLQKRMRVLKLRTFSEYLDYVFGEAGEKTELIHMMDAVTTNKTEFFREADHFIYLKEKVLPSGLEKSQWGVRNPLRLWSAGCSTGEEPYTLAMVLEEFRESISDKVRDFRYHIFATDVSTAVLERGEKAIYPLEKIEPVSLPLRKKYLLKSKDSSAKLVRVKPMLRKNIRFERLNLMQRDYYFDQKFEIIFCRNVIIYFDREKQEILLRRFFEHLVPGGYLFLGHSETLCGLDIPFISVAPTVYQKPDMSS